MLISCRVANDSGGAISSTAETMSKHEPHPPIWWGVITQWGSGLWWTGFLSKLLWSSSRTTKTSKFTVSLTPNLVYDRDEAGRSFVGFRFIRKQLGANGRVPNVEREITCSRENNATFFFLWTTNKTLTWPCSFAIRVGFVTTESTGQLT